MSLRFLTAGESHGPALAAILEGLPAGLNIVLPVINHELERRQSGSGAGARMKIERDQVRILSGVMEGKTIGSPLAMLIENRDHDKWYNKPIPALTIPRPGHADLSATLKYGYSDLRPALERASARETAARVAVGAICKLLLSEFNVRVEGYVRSIGEIEANIEDIPIETRYQLAEQSSVRCPDESSSKKMEARISGIMEEKDTLGGIIDVLVFNPPPGLGSHVQWDRRLDARLGAAILSIQAMKGVEIGDAFRNAHLSGTQAQDAIYLEGEKLVRHTLRSGGIEGGISTGDTILIRAAMKPIATTLTPQASVDLFHQESAKTRYERSDYCPVPRAVPIVESMAAFVIADALVEKLGGDSIAEMKNHYQTTSQSQLSDLNLDGKEHIFWKE